PEDPVSLSRPALGAAAALFSSLLSLDPGVSAPPRPSRPARPLITPSPDPAPVGSAAAPPPVDVLDAVVPEDLRVEVRLDPRGHGRNVVVSRPGHLVALGHGAIRAAGKDWASMHIETSGSGEEPSRSSKKSGVPAKRPGDREIDRLIWETT